MCVCVCCVYTYLLTHMYACIYVCVLYAYLNQFFIFNIFDIFNT